MNANDILFRCSSLGYLMTESRSLNPISETTITHLIDVFVSNKYQRFTEINGKALDKGNETEEDSITTVSRIKKVFLKKNEKHLSNAYIKGTPDVFEGEEIEKATHVIDTKSSWDAFTFFRAKNKKLDSKYKWQGTGYMALTGAEKCTIAYCLNNTPYHLVERELKNESYNHLENDTPAWIELQVISNHVYDKKAFNQYIEMRGIIPNDKNAISIYNSFVEIPLEERYFGMEFKRNDEDILRLYKKIELCRAYMNEKLFNDSLTNIAA